MLILSRRKGGSIKIDDDIEIFMAEIKGDRMRSSISASESMRICRTELHPTVENSKEASDKVDLLKVFQLSGSLKTLGTEGGQKKEGKDGAA